MAKRTSRPLHELPRTEEALAVLLRTVERHLQFIEPAVRRQATRLESLREMLDAPASFSNQLDFQRRLGEASRAQWAEGGPSFDVLVPYVDAAEMRRLLDLRQRARQRMATRSESATQSSAGLRAWLRALAELVQADEGIVAMFQRLQRRILRRLEDVAQTRADTAKRIARVLPRNPDILRLYFTLEQESSSESSQNEIAIDFTEGHVPRARSLLRGVRRFRERLRKRG